MLKKAVSMTLLFALVAMQVPVAALATQSSGASATSLRGTVQTRNGNGAWTNLSGTVPVTAGVSVRTAGNGTALIQLASGGVVRLSPNTTATLSSITLAGPAPRLQMQLDGRAYARTSGLATTISTRNGVVTSNQGEFLVDAASPGGTRLQVVSGTAHLAGSEVRVAGSPRSASVNALDGTRGLVLVADGGQVAADDQNNQNDQNDHKKGHHHGLTPQETALLIIGGAVLIAIIAIVASNSAASK